MLGCIRYYLKNYISNSDDFILFVGYCVYNMLGLVICVGIDLVYIFGELYKVKVKIESFDGFFGYVDKSELVDYVKSLTGDIKKIFVVHGEEDLSLVFVDTFCQFKSSVKVIVPELNELFEV